MAEKIRISKRTVRKPSTPNRQHSATKAIPSDPAKMTKAQRRSEKHRILEERNQQILELGSRLAPLHLQDFPKSQQGSSYRWQFQLRLASFRANQDQSTLKCING